METEAEAGGEAEYALEEDALWNDVVERQEEEEEEGEYNGEDHGKGEGEESTDGIPMIAAAE